MNIDLSKYAVRGADGSFDVSATVEKFRGDCDKYVAEREMEEGAISEAVLNLFTKVALGGSLNVPYILNGALTALNAQPHNHAALQERVHDWLRANSQGEVTGEGDARKEERPESLLVISKGKNGGVRIRADRDAAEAAKKAAAAQAAKK